MTTDEQRAREWRLRKRNDIVSGEQYDAELAALFARRALEARKEALEEAAQACENEGRCYADNHRAHDEFCHNQDAAAIRSLAAASKVERT